MKKMLNLLVVAVLIAVPAYVSAARLPTPVTSQVSIEDHFSGTKISSLWSIVTGGQVTITQANNSIRINGPYLGYAQTGGNVLSTKSVPARDFRYSVDILEPGANSNLGTYACINVDGDNGTFVTIQHWAGSYRVAYGTPNGWNAVYMPEFGDEKTTVHNYKIVYNSVTKEASAYVDETLIATVPNDLGATVKYGFFAHGSSAGNPLDVLFSNVIMRYKK